MKDVRLFLPGEFEDVFIYMGRLFLLTSHRSLLVYDLNQIVANIEEHDPNTVPLATLMFLRNDWLSNAQFKLILRNPHFASSMLVSLQQFPQPYFDITASVPSPTELDLKVRAQLILDILIYNGRFYAAADTGFYHVDFEWIGGNVSLSDRITKRHDARCVSVTAKYGAVASSCGDDGLFTATDEFQWANYQAPNGMRRTDTRSIKAEWSNYDLVNYRSTIQPYLLRNRHERIKRSRSGWDAYPGLIDPRGRRIEAESSFLTEIGTERFGLDYLLEMLLGKYSVENASVQYMYNSNNVFFVSTFSGEFYSLGLAYPKSGAPRPAFYKSYVRSEGQILSAHAFKDKSLIIETADALLLFHQNKWHPIVKKPILQVRTFMRSRHYQNLVAVVIEEGVLIISLFDDDKLVTSSP